MKSTEIRNKFLKFFEEKGHKIVPSDSLVPKNDPSVLFTSAGMNQFKEQFMGNLCGFKRAVSVQKCLRTADLENVGKSLRHHSFFEMLGNFSFGDYFKPEAIKWAWEFITGVLNLPENRLWITLHKDDFKAYEIWVKEIGINPRRIIKLGDNDNFWPANAPKQGPNGPCGPCSEIFYDWGEEFGCKRPDCSPACSCGRFTEIWNLVFTQYERQTDGTLLPLPNKNIDTGMGLERIASVMQNVRSNYQTDLFVPILSAIGENLARDNISSEQGWMQTKARAVADHMRAAVFAIADGVVPCNEKQGYVIRKLIRRSVVYLKQIGVKKPFCYKLVYSIAQIMQDHYPETQQKHEFISGVIKNEEDLFWKIIKERSPQAEVEFKTLLAGLENKKNSDKAQITDLITKAAFIQYDTYGVPLEISKAIVQRISNSHIEISDLEFEKQMESQRSRSRGNTMISNEIFVKTAGTILQGIVSEFRGYEHLECSSNVLAILKDDTLVNTACKGEKVEIVIAQTPFYAESGGQDGDRGEFVNDFFLAEIVDTKKVGQAILHSALIKKGILKSSDKVTAKVDFQKRANTARNHTATHLLQYALRKKLGKHIQQSGSYVCAEKLRFDFTHLSSLGQDTLKDIELIVNQCVWQNLPVETKIMDINQAKAAGALAFFQEKYGENVRMVCIGDCSKELCGGTHIHNTGEIGFFKITTESSIAQGVRRIEGVTAMKALDVVQHNKFLLNSLNSILKTSSDKVVDAAQKLVLEVKAQENELQKLKQSLLLQETENLINNACSVEGINLVIAEIKGLQMDGLRRICDLVKNKLEPVICVLGACFQNKGFLVLGISSSLCDQGLDAVKMIKKFTALTGGGGGGKKELAQAGTKDIPAFKNVIVNANEIIQDFLKQVELS